MHNISKRARIASLGDEIPVNNSKGLDDQRKEGTFCDMTLQGKDIQIKVHKNIMYSASEYFRDLLESGMKESSTGEVDLRHIPGHILQKIVSFVYLGKLKPNSPEEVEEIMKNAGYLRITKLIEVCSLFLEMCINDLNCMKYWRLAEEYSTEELGNACITYILTSNNGQLFASFFTNFTVEEMQKLLVDDRLKGTEEEIFETILKWAKYRTTTDTASLLTTFSRVHEFIRFPLIEKEFLSSKVLSNKDLVEDQNLIKSISECAGYENKCDSPFLIQKCITPRIGSHKPELLALHGGTALKISNKGILPLLRSATLKDCGYTTFGSNLLLICGGLNDDNSRKSSSFYFSPITKQLKDFPQMLRNNFRHSCNVIENKIYACGGCYPITEYFDLDRGRWYYGQTMNEQRTSFGLSVVNNSLYAVGGSNNFTVEMFDPRNWKGWSSIFYKSYNFNRVKCASIGNDIYCFTDDRQFVFDTRINKLRRWDCDVNILKKKECKFDVCEINGEIGIFAANDSSLNFYKCNVDGEITLNKYTEGPACKYIAVVTMYC